MSAFTPAQRAELRDAIARSRLEAMEEKARRITRAPVASPKPRRRRAPVLPPKAAPAPKPTAQELELADRLMPHIATDSVIDRRRHALGVARLITQGRRR